MSISIESVLSHVNRQSIDPEIFLDISYSFDNEDYVPISHSGHLLLGGLKIANLVSQNHNNNIRLPLRLIPLRLNVTKQVITKGTRTIRMAAPISRIALDRVSELREANEKKEVSLMVELDVQLLIPKVYNSPIFQDDKTSINVVGHSEFKLLEVEESKALHGFSIAGGDWVVNFSEQLGLGKYRILELPDLGSVSENGTLEERYGAAVLHFQDMEKNFRNGEWNSVMQDSRLMWELLNIDAMAEIIEHDEQDLELKNAFKNLLQGFFTLASKFGHSTGLDRKRVMIKPKAFKEDAFMCYTMAAASLNLIAKRLGRNRSW